MKPIELARAMEAIMDFLGALVSDGASVWRENGELVGVNARDRGPVVSFDRVGVAGSGSAFVSTRDVARISARTPAAPSRPTYGSDPVELAELGRLRDWALSEGGYTLEQLLAAHARDGCAEIRARRDAAIFFGTKPAEYWQVQSTAETPALPTTSFEALSASYWARAAQ